MRDTLISVNDLVSIPIQHIKEIINCFFHISKRDKTAIAWKTINQKYRKINFSEIFEIEIFKIF